MKKITIEIKCLLRFSLDLVEFPELTSTKIWVQKGLDLLKKHTPKILSYLSKQKILSELKDYQIILRTSKSKDNERIKHSFQMWLQKEKMKRLVFVVIEAMLIPFTAPLAVLPGPNFFFYIPALLLYYHYGSYKGLKKARIEDMDIEIIHTNKSLL
ncbi:MAG: hypothetical protein GY757_27775 [bacterium]|nr:hypothetical protein [bacterium]